MNGTRAFIAFVAVFVAVLILIWRANHPRGQRVIGRRVTLSELLEPVQSLPVVHRTPEHDAVPQVTPCCSVPVMDLPRGIHLSHDQQDVTCTGPQTSNEEK